MKCRLLTLAVACLAWNACVAQAEEQPRTVEQVAKEAAPSVVVVTHTGRDGEPQGLGTGFVISSDGLIATNLHVIGEARPIKVQFADGRQFDVTSVHASDRTLDLALLKIDAEKLPALPLGDSAQLASGANVVALGNPRGLKHSVVAGVISGKPQVDAREMLQLALPIEPGNSGGPVLDMQGRAMGLVTLKSAVSENLGFAVPINALKPLLEKPNPVPMARWLTIGTLSKDWTPLFGARWQQRAGRISVAGKGAGFGGRSLCLWQPPLPEPAFELAVWVKLHDEAGAAGLVFQSDGADRHYGFYPTNGRLRFTRFAGPTVLQWTVVREFKSPHYRPGEWNELKVRLEPAGKFRCYVNGELVLEITDEELTAGKVGLAKFRDTEADFKGFRVGREVATQTLSAEKLAQASAHAAKLPPLASLQASDLAPLLNEPQAGLAALRSQAAEFEQRAAKLKQMADYAHVQHVVRQLEKLVANEEQLDLARAALLVAQLDHEDLDIPAYLAELDRLAAEIKRPLPPKANEAARFAALNKHLFQECGFHGSRSEYYHAANSHLNRVLDDREGLPLTLSIVYLELARRLELSVVGIPLPGHFVVEHRPTAGERQFVDVFDGGKLLTRAEAAKASSNVTGREPTDEDFSPATKRAMLDRLLRNLKGLAESKADRAGMLRYLEALVALNAHSVPDRGQRAVIRFESGLRAAAVSDLDWLIDQKPEGLDLDQLRELRLRFQEE